MTTTTRCRRISRRFSIADNADASIELGWPEGAARRVKARLLDISMSGLSFAMPAEAPRLTSGIMVNGVTLRLGRCEIGGDLLIMHVTQRSQGPVCGALFYPAGDAELALLKSAIAGIEAVLPR
jgi:hypothetical protein